MKTLHEMSKHPIRTASDRRDLRTAITAHNERVMMGAFKRYVAENVVSSKPRSDRMAVGE